MVTLKKRSLWCRVIISTRANGQDGSGERSRDTSRDVQTMGSTQFPEEPGPWASNQETMHMRQMLSFMKYGWKWVPNIPFSFSLKTLFLLDLEHGQPAKPVMTTPHFGVLLRGAQGCQCKAGHRGLWMGTPAQARPLRSCWEGTEHVEAVTPRASTALPRGELCEQHGSPALLTLLF